MLGLLSQDLQLLEMRWMRKTVEICCSCCTVIQVCVLGPWIQQNTTLPGRSTKMYSKSPCNCLVCYRSSNPNFRLIFSTCVYASSMAKRNTMEIHYTTHQAFLLFKVIFFQSIDADRLHNVSFVYISDWILHTIYAVSKLFIGFR